MTKGDWHDLNRLEHRALVILTMVQDAHMSTDEFERMAKLLHTKALAEGLAKYIEKMYLGDIADEDDV